MMNTRRSSKFMLSRYVLVLPLLVFISLAFTFNKKMANHPIKPVHVSVQQASPVNELSYASIAVSKRKIAPIKRVSSTVLHQINSESDDLSQADDQLADTISHTEALPKRLATIVILKRKNESIDKLSTASFVLNDTSGMVLPREQLGEYEKAGLNGIRKVVLIRATKSSNNPLIGDPQSPITYHVDGKQITGEDLKAIDPAKIKSFKLVKGNGGEIYMNTKP